MLIRAVINGHEIRDLGEYPKYPVPRIGDTVSLLKDRNFKERAYADDRMDMAVMNVIYDYKDRVIFLVLNATQTSECSSKKSSKHV